MKKITMFIMIFMINIVWAGVDYTGRHHGLHNTCHLFANDVMQASEKYKAGINLEELLKYIESANVPNSMKERAFQAIQFVWKNEIDNKELAQSLAMGLCLSPKKEMSPIDEPFLNNPRTFKDNL